LLHRSTRILGRLQGFAKVRALTGGPSPHPHPPAKSFASTLGPIRQSVFESLCEVALKIEART